MNPKKARWAAAFANRLRVIVHRYRQAIVCGLVLGACLGPTASIHAEAVPEGADSVCHSDDRYAAFDFWLGEWKIFSPDGRFGGVNRIARAEDGCVITEHWTGPRGETGRSVSYYDPVDQQWRQLWFSRDFTIDYTGNLDAEGAMVLEGEITYRKSLERRRFRGTWTPLSDGEVRQHFEEFDPASNQWRVWFSAVYGPMAALAE